MARTTTTGATSSAHVGRSKGAIPEYTSNPRMLRVARISAAGLPEFIGPLYRGGHRGLARSRYNLRHEITQRTLSSGHRTFEQPHHGGARRAAEAFRADLPAATSGVRISLHGSLAATGRGHLTDVAVGEPFAPLSVDLLWLPDKILPRHTNGMLFEALDEDGQVLLSRCVYSVGGGALLDEAGNPDGGGDVLSVYLHEGCAGTLRTRAPGLLGKWCNAASKRVSTCSSAASGRR